MLHRGPYAAEAPTIEALHAFIAAQGYVFAGKHHEIYLKDPQRTAPERLETVIRDLAAILDGAVRGQQVMAAQRYEPLDRLVDGNRVVLEVQWTGTLAIPLGALPAGGQMRARFAVFLTYRDGKIAHQRNYDCFEPW